MRQGVASHPGQSDTGSALRLLVCLLAGALLATALMVAWSCRTTRSGIVPSSGLSGGLSITSADGAAARPEPMMRIRIARQVESATIDGRGPWLVAVEGSRTGEILAGPVTITNSSGGVRVADAYERVRGFGPGTPVYVGPVLRQSDRTGDEIVNLNKSRYPGTLRILPSQDEPERLDVINVVEIERYIPGVISKEIFPHWDEKAFMAQAVAARTYALQRRESARKANRPFDVDDSEVDQVYGGLTGQRVALRAADATRGVVLTSGNRLAEAYYAAICGGHPALPEEIWPPNVATPVVQKVGYAPPAANPANASLSREILCQKSPLYEWEVARRTDELTKRLQAWGKDRGHELGSLGMVAKVDIIDRTQTGRSMTVKVTDTSGKSVTMTAEQFRTAANFPTPALKDVPTIARVNSNDFTVEVGRTVTVIDGRGHGHGVGLCQYCMQGMASRGDDWHTILKSFYPQYTIMRIY